MPPTATETAADEQQDRRSSSEAPEEGNGELHEDRRHDEEEPATLPPSPPVEAEEQMEARPASATEASEDEAGDSKKKKKPVYKRPIPMILLAIVLLGGVGYGAYYYIYSMGHTWTDDAFINANITQVSPRVMGQVEQVHVTDNQQVKKGDVLVRLDPTVYQSRVDQALAAREIARGELSQAKSQLAVAKAGIGTARADVAVAQANVNLAQTNLKRYRRMFAKQAVSQQQVDDAVNKAQTTTAKLQAAKQGVASAQAQQLHARSAVQAAKADVRQAGVQLAQAKLMLSYTKIQAPVTGRVTQKNVEVGDHLEAGQQMFALVPTYKWVKANFKETEISDMRPGQPVDIAVDAYPDHTFKGRVESIQAGTGAKFSLLPPENATGNYVKVVQRVPVKIVFKQMPDPAKYLLAPGMSVVPTVNISSGEDRAMNKRGERSGISD